MGLEILLDKPVEQGAEIVKNYLKKGYSKELGLNSHAEKCEASSLFLPRIEECSLKLTEKVQDILRYMMQTYKYDKDENYLSELSVLAVFFTVDYTPMFLADIKMSPFYAELKRQTKYHIERGIVTFDKHKPMPNKL